MWPARVSMGDKKNDVAFYVDPPADLFQHNLILYILLGLFLDPSQVVLGQLSNIPLGPLIFNPTFRVHSYMYTILCASILRCLSRRLCLKDEKEKKTHGLLF